MADRMCKLQPHSANLLDNPLSVVQLALYHVASPSGLTPACVAVTRSFLCMFVQPTLFPLCHKHACVMQVAGCKELAFLPVPRWHYMVTQHMAESTPQRVAVCNMIGKQGYCKPPNLKDVGDKKAFRSCSTYGCVCWAILQWLDQGLSAA